MDVDQHNDNEGTLEAAENDEDTEYDKNQCSKITRDGEDHDDVYDDANEEDQDKADERLLSTLNQQQISTKVRTSP